MVSCDRNLIDNGDDGDAGLNNFPEDTQFVGVLCLFFSI